MKLTTKIFLSAISVFVLTIALTAVTSFKSFKTSGSSISEIYVSSLTKIGNIE